MLGVSPYASTAEIKSAYRALVKQHHPDAGGDSERILALNAAWEVLGDGDRRRHYDASTVWVRASQAGIPTSEAGASADRGRRRGVVADQNLACWLTQVYEPIDALLAEVINPFPGEWQALAADPYDDSLMQAFCAFLERSQQLMVQVEGLYQSHACPRAAQGFGLSLYHCLSLVSDSLVELDRYTMGYVDAYLHDGREMLGEAAQRHRWLQQERSCLDL